MSNAPVPPVARKDPVRLEKHGDVRIDEYGWLRDKESPEVVAHLEAENAYTDEMTAHLANLRETIYEEILGRIQETDLSVPERDGDWWYLSRTEEGKSYPIHCRRESAGGAAEDDEEVLLDVNALAEGHDYTMVPIVEPSPDHRLLAYTIDLTGAEDYTLRIKDLETGDLLDDRLESLDYSVAWANDSRTLFYTTKDDAKRAYRVWRHRLGEPQSSDDLLFEEPDERFRVGLFRTRSRAFVLFGTMSLKTSEWWALDADRPDEEARLIQAREDGIEYEVDHHGDRFLIVTNADGAVNFKLVEAPVDAPSRENWRDLRPYRPEVRVEGVSPFENHLVVKERKDGVLDLVVIDVRTGQEHEIDLPETSRLVGSSGNRMYETSAVRFRYTSLVTPWSVYDYDMDSRSLDLRKREPVLGGYDPANYASERIEATAPDGVKVPISLCYRKGLERDGAAPAFLTGYGAYGMAYDPMFLSARLSLVDRGFVFAIAHVRGGGDKGRPWYEDGKFLAKKNTFSDFVACSEHLVAEGYTSAAKLAISGGSAGGLLMGAVVNARPDLFGCVVAEVPFVDVISTMLDPTIPLTVPEYEEWGNPEDPGFYAAMRAYSPYDNVEAKDYPPILATAGLNDPRVHYWEPAKWTARLRDRKTDDNVLLLKTQMGAGHGGPSGRYESYRERAFVYAFVLDALSVAEGADTAT